MKDDKINLRYNTTEVYFSFPQSAKGSDRRERMILTVMYDSDYRKLCLCNIRLIGGYLGF